MENPFKFGSIVEDEYFTDRKVEREYLAQILASPNHAVLIGPRRFGKSSLVAETLKHMNREIISVNMQMITSPEKLAETIYRKYFEKHPLDKAWHNLSHVRIVPTVAFDSVTGSPQVTLLPGVNRQVVLEDAFSLLEKAGQEERLVVVLDEFQEVMKIGEGLDKILRSIMQEQKNINYILMGSQEDMMKNIFLGKKSPFYHFGSIVHIGRIPASDFRKYIEDRLPLYGRGAGIADRILSFTNCHLYYTQQLSFQVWFELAKNTGKDNAVERAIDFIIQSHDFDYSRLWESMNKTNKTVLLKLVNGSNSPMEDKTLPSSTIYSALKRLVSSGILIKNSKYEIDDPFFRLWIMRNQ